MALEYVGKRLFLRLRGGFDGRNDIVDAADDGEQIGGRLAGESMIDNVLDQVGEGLPVAFVIDQDHGLVMKVQLPPGDNLERLVHRAEAARQDDEGVRQVEHLLFSRMHGVDNVQFGKTIVRGDDRG